jgi:serine/threonine protein kinase
MFDELQRRASDDERNLTQERRLQEFLVGTLSQEDIGDLHTDVPSVLLERALRPYQDRREVIEAFDRSRLFFLHVIGTGAFARVDLALYDLRLVAVKKLNPISDEERTVVQNEIELHRKLQCRTLLRMYGTYESRDGVDVHLVLEYAHYGSLRGVYKGTHLAERPWKKMRGVDGDVDVDVSLEQRVRYLRDVLEAVSYLHGERVFHRDIKCDNVLIREDMTALLGDLGLSRQLSASQSRASSKEVGTPVFRAPEVNASTPDGYKCSADIYSIGITIMELLLSEIPPNPTKGQEHLQRLRTECPGLAFPLEQLRRIAMHCTVVAPEDRPCADQVLQWLSVDLYNVEIPTH